MAKIAITNRDNMANNSLLGSNKKILERTLLILAIAGTIWAAFLYGDVIGRVKELIAPKETVYGVWVEQNVASYSTRVVEIGPDGIMMEGRVYTTKFDYDGRYLEFSVAGQNYKFKMMNEENTEMKQISDAPYNPIFHLAEKSESFVHEN